MMSDSSPRVVIIAGILIAMFFVVIAYDRDLPVAELDEGILLTQTVYDRGLVDETIFQLTGYPPVIMTLFTITQHMTEAIFQEPVLDHAGVVMRAVRMMAILANCVTVLILVNIGRMLRLPMVGLVSSIIWAIMPLVHKQTSLALTEPWQVVFVTASALAMIYTFETRQARWAVLCTIMGLFAVLSKYNAFPILGFGVGTSLWLIVSTERKAYWSGVLVTQGLLIAATAFVLFTFYGAGNLVAVGRPEAAQFVNAGYARLFDIQTIIYIFSVASEQMALPGLFLLVAVLVSGLGLYFYRTSATHRVIVIFMLIFVVAHIWFVPTYLVYDVLKHRYISTTSSMLVFLLTLSVWQFTLFSLRQVKREVWQPAIFAIVALIWVVPPAWVRLHEAWRMQYPLSAEVLADWSAASLEPNATLAITGRDGNTMRWRYFNSIWGDYTGPYRPVEDILLYLQEPKSAWLDAGINYIHLTGSYPGSYPTLPFPRDELLLMKSFPPPASSIDHRGDAWYIYRLEGPENITDIGFGDAISLMGYDLSTSSVAVGDDIALRMYWQADQTPVLDYQMFLHLSGLDEHTVLSQIDSPPALDTRLTTTWDDPGEVMVSERYTLPIPSELEAGSYRILLGLYDLTTGVRLTSESGQDAVELARIQVVERP